MDHMHDMNGIAGMAQGHPRIPLPVGSDQGMSEFNHHLAGVALLLMGVSAILTCARPGKFGYLRYVWPVSLLILGLYLMVYSDPPSWPSGTIGLAQSLQDPEVRQHKVYALLLLTMGGVEMARAIDIHWKAELQYAFPILGFIGAIYLIFHKHGGRHMTMDPSAHLEVLYQHIFYIVAGVAAVVSRVLYDAGKLGQRWAPYLWPSLVTILGLALVLYRE